MASNLRKKDWISMKNIQVQMMKKKKLDSNPSHSDLNPRIWKCEERMNNSNSRKMDSNLIYKMKLKVKD